MKPATPREPFDVEPSIQQEHGGAAGRGSLRGLEGGLMHRAVNYLTAAMFLLSVLYVGVRALKQETGNDAAVMYFATRVLLHGRNPYDQAEMRAEWEASRREGNTRPMPSPFANPPSMGLLVAPIAVLPISIALRLYTAINICCLLLTIFLLDRMLLPSASPAVRWLLATWSMMQPPTMKLLSYGQSGLLICASLAVAIYALRRKSEIWAGFWLALSFAKFTISLPFLAVLVVRGRWKAAWTSLAVFAGLNLALAVPAGLEDVVTSYRNTLLTLDGINGMNDPFSKLAIEPYNMVNAKSFFVLVLGKDRATVTIALWLFTIACGAMFIYEVWRNRKSEHDALEDPLEIALATMIALALAYHRVYDLAALVFVIYALADYRLRNPTARRAVWVTAMATSFALSFFVVGTRWSLPFDLVLAKLRWPPSPYFGSVFVVALLLEVLLLTALRSTRTSLAVPSATLTRVA